MQILWQLDNNSQPIPPVTIANGSTANYFDISLPGLAPTSPGTASWVQRFNVPYNVPNISGGFGKKNLTTWIALPDSDTYVSLGNGLKGKIEILTGNYTKRGVYSGSAIYSGPYQYLEWTNGNFPSAVQKGTQYPLVQNYFTDTKLRVHIDKGSAFAGVYNISIPIKIGSEEWVIGGEKTCVRRYGCRAGCWRYGKPLFSGASDCSSKLLSERKKWHRHQPRSDNVCPSACR